MNVEKQARQVSPRAVAAVAGIFVIGGAVVVAYGVVTGKIDPIYGCVPFSMGALLLLWIGVRGAAPAAAAPTATLLKKIQCKRLRDKALYLRAQNRITEAREIEAQADALTAELYPKERARLHA